MQFLVVSVLSPVTLYISMDMQQDVKSPLLQPKRLWIHILFCKCMHNKISIYCCIPKDLELCHDCVWVRVLLSCISIKSTRKTYCLIFDRVWYVYGLSCEFIVVRGIKIRRVVGHSTAWSGWSYCNFEGMWSLCLPQLFAKSFSWDFVAVILTAPVLFRLWNLLKPKNIIHLLG